MIENDASESRFLEHLEGRVREMREQGTFKTERLITSSAGTRISVGDRTDVLNMCANNYLGLAQDPNVIEASKRAIDDWGYGLASVRFICGTQSLHKELGI